MSRVLHNDAVELTLGSGDWTAHWSEPDITLGPCVAGFGPKGAWKITTTRTGARARWTSEYGWFELLLPADGDTVTIQVARTSAVDGTIDDVFVLDCPLSFEPVSRLIEGYDSWSWAGVRAAEGAAASSWRTTLVSAVRCRHRAPGPFRRPTCHHNHLRRRARERACRWFTRIDRARGHVGSRSECAGPARPADRRRRGVRVRADRDHCGPRPGGDHRAARHPCRSSRVVRAARARLGVLVPLRDRDRSRRTCSRTHACCKERFGGRPGFDLFQIDDGWQQTYGAWWPNDRFPSDLGELVEQIHRLDLRCGLWLAPFMIVPGAIGLGTNHEDWCLRDRATGETFRDRHDRWALDASNPDVIEFLHELGTQVKAWGVDMVKLDFLYQGAQEGTRHNPRVAGTEALRRGLRAFVDPLGDDVYVLGCGAPLLPMVGICHANRIGHDLAVPVIAREFGQPLTDGWTGWHGIKAQARQAIARAALHGRWFDNDPEVVMAWGSDGRGGADGYSLEEAHTQAVVAALVGGPWLLADELNTLLPDERAVLEDPAVLDLAWDARGFRPLDLFDHLDDGPEHAYAQPRDLPSVWVAERAGGAVVALANWTDEPAVRVAPDGTKVEIPAHGIRVLRA